MRNDIATFGFLLLFLFIAVFMPRNFENDDNKRTEITVQQTDEELQNE